MWYRYIKQQTENVLLEITGENIYEHGIVDGLTYFYSTDDVFNDWGLVCDQITPDNTTLSELKKQSNHYQLINQRIVARIREKYDDNEERKMLRVRDIEPDAFNAYNTYVEECIQWGVGQKQAIGF